MSLQRKPKVNMTTKILMATAAAPLIALTGCSTPLTNQQIGTGTGAVIGNEIGKKQDRKR